MLNLAELDGGGGRKKQDAELAKAMFEGTQQFRRKLKMPELNPLAERFKEEVHLSLTSHVQPSLDPDARAA